MVSKGDMIAAGIGLFAFLTLASKASTSMSSGDVKRHIIKRTYPPTNQNFELADSQWGDIDYDTVDFWAVRRLGVDPYRMTYFIYTNTAGMHSVYVAEQGWS